MKGTCLLRRVIAVTAVALLFGAEPPTLAEDDLLPAESYWKGTLTQRSKSSDGMYFPPELQAELKITRRDGADFEGELREQSEGLDVTFLVRGKLLRGADKSYTLEFKSYAVKGVPTAAVYYVNVPYTARVSDGGLAGSWAYEDKEADVALDGEFKLKRADE